MAAARRTRGLSILARAVIGRCLAKKKRAEPEGARRDIRDLDTIRSANPKRCAPDRLSDNASVLLVEQIDEIFAAIVFEDVLVSEVP
jgi:hypothetical protein